MKKTLLIICGLLAVFVAGFVIGKNNISNNVEFTYDTCSSIERNMKNSEVAVEKLREWKRMLVNNCSKWKIEREKREKPVVLDEVQMLPQQTCAAIETLLLNQIKDGFNEWETNTSRRIEKAQIYVNLVGKGCPENRNKYIALAVREIEIARALANEPLFDAAFLYKKLGMMSEAMAIMGEIKKAGGDNDGDLERELMK